MKTNTYMSKAIIDLFYRLGEGEQDLICAKLQELNANIISTASELAPFQGGAV